MTLCCPDEPLRSAEAEVLDLWEGEFDTWTIAGTLTDEGLPITEAEVSRIIAADQDRRYFERCRMEAIHA